MALFDLTETITTALDEPLSLMRRMIARLDTVIALLARIAEAVERTDELERIAEAVEHMDGRVLK